MDLQQIKYACLHVLRDRDKQAGYNNTRDFNPRPYSENGFRPGIRPAPPVEKRRRSFGDDLVRALEIGTIGGTAAGIYALAKRFGVSPAAMKQIARKTKPALTDAKTVAQKSEPVVENITQRAAPMAENIAQKNGAYGWGAGTASHQ